MAKKQRDIYFRKNASEWLEEFKDEHINPVVITDTCACYYRNSLVSRSISQEGDVWIDSFQAECGAIVVERVFQDVSNGKI